MGFWRLRGIKFAQQEMKTNFFESPPTAVMTGAAPNRKIVILSFTATPSVNEWNGRHWSVYAKVKKQWLARLGLVIKDSMRFQRAEITVIRYARRMLDAGNAADGMKPIVDALVDLHVLPNDTLKHLPTAPIVEQVQTARTSKWNYSVIRIQEKEL